ncbi:MAG: hypothetical protein AAFV80_20545, partial [Bacteroidota bacterium]
MKRCFLVLVVMFVGYPILFAQGWVTFLEEEVVLLIDVKATNDGGCLALGLPTFNDGIGKLLKLDADGNLQWQQVLPDADPQIEYEQLEITPDGDLLVLFEKEDDDLLVLRKYDPTANLIWEIDRPLGSNLNIEFFIPDLAVTATGDIYLSYQTGNEKYVRKLDPSGNLLWENVIEWEHEGFGYFSIAVDELGQLLVGGRDSIPPNPFFTRGTLRKYDVDGNVILDYFDPNGPYQLIGQVGYFGDGRFVFSARSINNDISNHLGIVNVDGTIDTISKAWFPDYFDQTDWPPYGGVVSNANGNLGTFYGTTIGQGDRFHSMIQLDSDGNFVWDQTIVGPSYLLEGTDMAEDGSIFTAWWLGGTSAIMKASGPAPITNGVVSGRIFRNLGSNCAPTTSVQQIGLADWHILFI